MKSLLAFFLSIIHFLAYAQNEYPVDVDPITIYVPGKIVLHNKSEVEGEIRVRNEGLSQFINRIQFKDKNGNKEYYKAGEISEFVMDIEKKAIFSPFFVFDSLKGTVVVYKSFTHPEKQDQFIFLQRLLSGEKMSLYNDPKATNTETGVDDIVISSVRNSYYVEKNGEIISVRKKEFYDMADFLFQDCELLMRQEDIYYEELADLIRTYNSCFN